MRGRLMIKRMLGYDISISDNGNRSERHFLALGVIETPSMTSEVSNSSFINTVPLGYQL